MEVLVTGATVWVAVSSPVVVLVIAMVVARDIVAMTDNDGRG